jgi:hypothetical protein
MRKNEMRRGRMHWKILISFCFSSIYSCDCELEVVAFVGKFTKKCHAMTMN